MSLFIITGGPGVGKTILVDFLKSKDFSVVPESARAIIRDQVYKVTLQNKKTFNF